MVGSTNDVVSLFRYQTWDSSYKELWKLLNENDIELFFVF